MGILSMYGVGIDGIHTGMFSAGRTHEIMPFCDLALRLASSFTMYARGLPALLGSCMVPCEGKEGHRGHQHCGNEGLALF